MTPNQLPGSTGREGATNLVILADSGYLSGCYGDRFYKRVRPVCSDLGVVQYEFSRHGSLRFKFVQMD